MASGKIKHFKKDNGYELIPRELLQACDKNSNFCKDLSLQAIGLLVNLQSYPETWVLSKSELYKRYSKNGKTSVTNAWNELVEKKFIVQFHKREGKVNNYVYYFSLAPFTENDIKQIESLENNESSKTLNLKDKYGKAKTKQQPKYKLKKRKRPLFESQSLSFSVSTSQNEILKMNCSKPESNVLHREEITQEEITHKENSTSDMNDMNDNAFVRGGQNTHSNHTNHNKQIIEELTLKEFELQSFPQNTKAYLKNFDIQEVRILKGVILKAKESFNKNNSTFFTLEDIDITLEEILKRFKAILIQKCENVSDMQSYLMQSILSELDVLRSLQSKRQKRNNNEIFDWLNQG
ncbi:hypothetical protein [Staphylococcus equorum]|uniref:Replication initiator protein A C-terminal domain-containing protein n=1 Tax=Staphylococcus equorum TaxID=246432 RepID=A0AAP7LUY3_9STAP|nr:hypothetical protein [Staphylococcus equorum]OEK58906.1 hypothetical protein ASS94_00865 [Staphylococcus equorum]